MNNRIQNRYNVDYDRNIVFNNRSLKQAVRIWYNNRQECIARYGHISSWNTSNVTDMKTLFSFNYDPQSLHYLLKKKYGQKPNIKNTKNMLSNFINILDTTNDELKIKELKELESKDDLIKKIDISRWELQIFSEDELKQKEKINKFEDEYFEYLIRISPVFNEDLSRWDTSNVKDMSNMFYLQINSNPNLSGWNTSKVENMSNMFYGALNFNSDISKWKTPELKFTKFMFFNAINFNQDLSKWDTSEIVDMSGMFSNSANFNNNNKTLNFIVDRETNTENVFKDSPLEQNTSEIINKINIFDEIKLKEALKLWKNTENNQIYREQLINNYGHISDWNISRTRTLKNLFMNNSEFNEDISKWNTYKVTDMSNTFYSAVKFNQDIGGWDTSKVTHMEHIFGFSGFDQDISKWDITQVRDKRRMLLYAFNLNFDKVIFSNYYLNPANGLIGPNPNIYFNNETIRIAVDLWISKPELAIQIYGNISEWKTHLVTDMSYLFYNKPIPDGIEEWNVSSVISMDYMFYIDLLEKENVIKELNDIIEELNDNLEESERIRLEEEKIRLEEERIRLEEEQKKLLNENKENLEKIFFNWNMISLKYAINIVNNNLDIVFNDSIDNLFTEISKTGVQYTIKDRIKRNKIFNESFNSEVTKYKIYEYDESKNDDIKYFYKNLATNLIYNPDFINNLNERRKIKTEFYENVGENFADNIDVGGYTKLLLFEKFLKFLYYDPKITRSTISCEKIKLENENREKFCPFILEDDQLKINPNLDIEGIERLLVVNREDFNNRFEDDNIRLEDDNTRINYEFSDDDYSDDDSFSYVYPETSISFDESLGGSLERSNTEISYAESLDEDLAEQLDDDDDPYEYIAFDSVNKFYQLVGILLRKIINTPLRRLNEGFGREEFYNAYIPFGKILACLITGEIRLDDNSSFDETNNILNLIDQLEDADQLLIQINYWIKDDNVDKKEEEFTNESADLLGVINFDHKLPFEKINNLYQRNLVIRQYLHWLKYNFNNELEANFNKEYFGLQEKKLVIIHFLCTSKLDLFERFQSFYDSMIKFNSNQTKFYDFHLGEIEVDNEFAAIFEQRNIIPTEIDLENRVTSRKLISEFTCHIVNERQKFIRMIELAELNIRQELKDRLQLFKELVENENDIDNETLIRLFIWFSGNRCCPDLATISVTNPSLYEDTDPKKYLFSAATCFNELRIPGYDFSNGFRIFIDEENQINSDRQRFYTILDSREYNKNKLKEILLFSMRF